jgi:hypothetical protein
VDRRRSRSHAGAAEADVVAAAVRALRDVVMELDRPEAETRPEPDTTCDPAPPLRREASA